MQGFWGLRFVDVALTEVRFKIWVLGEFSLV